MPGHSIEPAQGIHLLKAIIDAGHFAEVDLCAIPRSQQHDLLKILTVISLTAGLYANITVAALDGTSR